MFYRLTIKLLVFSLWL